jgi:hypothetical protein
MPVTHFDRGCWLTMAGGAAMLLVLGGAPAWAQQNGGIAGVVRDSGGLAMPGVTVEAASPALIEKVRSVVTDGEGRYNIVDLRPGTYSVTFSLPGFSTVRREGIELSAGFTAPLNVNLAVGAISETITVTGASPVVDTQSIRQQEVLNTRQLEALPSGSIGLQTLAYVTPGFASTQADVGGTRDTWSAQGAYTFFHGKTGTRASYDGFRNQYFIGAGNGVGYISDQGTIQELQLETSGMGAESGSGSASLNAIPKSGGNIFSGGIDGFFSGKGMQSSNIDDDFRAFGINSSAEVQKIYRLGAQLGGPIMKDKIWFFAAVARWGSRVNQPGAYYNKLQGKSGIPGTPTIAYEPDLDRPAASFDWFRNHSLRTTWQATEKHKFAFFGDIQKSCRCTTGPFTGANAIESERGWDWWPSGVVQGTWTAPLTNKLLVEAGASWQVANWINFAQEGVTRDDRSILETSTNFRYGATSVLTAPIARTGRSAQRLTASYVTGSHNFKAGVTLEQAFNDESRSRNNEVDGLNYDFLNGRPLRLQYQVEPYFQQERQNAELGIFVQDAWTIDRVTLNLGIRMDYVSMGFPAATLAAGRFVPERQVEELKGVPEWLDINPRAGVAVDVFGNGRTAVKASIGRFNQLTRSDLTRRFHPFTASGSTAFRNWNDLNGNFIPDCDLANFSAQPECGAMSDVNFGKFIPNATAFDDSVTKDNRDFLWDINVEVEHQIRDGLSVNVGYNHNWDGSFTVLENTVLGPESYDEYCITVPNDPRLPNAGQQQCGYYDVKPALFGLGTRRVTNAKEFGKMKRYWDGFWLGVNGRLPKGILVGGGLDIGRQVDDHCLTVDMPNQPNDISGAPMRGGSLLPAANSYNPFCRVVTDWENLMDIRLRASVPLPWQLNASFIYRNTPGAPVDATLALAQTAPQGATPIVRFNDPTRTTLTTAQTVNLYAPNSVFGDRFSQLDVALSKTFNLGWSRLRAALDVYNALNSNSTQSVLGAFSTATNCSAPTARCWQRPTGFLDARLARFTASINF